MTDDAKEIRPHPIFIANLLYPYLTFLIIPVIRGVVGYFVWGAKSVTSFFVAETFILSLAVVISLFKLKRTKIVINNGFYIKKGLFCRVDYCIKALKPTVIVVESNPILRPFGVYNLKIYSEAGVGTKPDEIIPINRNDAKIITHMFKVTGHTVKSRAKDRVLMAAALSSTSAGLLIAAPIVKITAGLLGKSVSSVLPKLAKGISVVEPIEITRWGTYLSLVLMAGYVVSFAVILMRNANFNACTNGKRLNFVSGILPYRRVMLNVLDISVVKAVVTPLMWIVRRCTVQFSACGYGKSRGELGVLVPSVDLRLRNMAVSKILPNASLATISLRPKRKAIRRCCYIPVTIALAVCLVAWLVNWHFPKVKALIIFVVGVIIVADIIFLLLKIYAVLNGGIGQSFGKISINCRKGLKFICADFKEEKIIMVAVTRTPFDRFAKTCTVKVFLNNKSRDSFSLPFISYNDCCLLKD